MQQFSELYLALLTDLPKKAEGEGVEVKTTKKVANVKKAQWYQLKSELKKDIEKAREEWAAKYPTIELKRLNHDKMEKPWWDMRQGLEYVKCSIKALPEDEVIPGVTEVILRFQYGSSSSIVDNFLAEQVYELADAPTA